MHPLTVFVSFACLNDLVDPLTRTRNLFSMWGSPDSERKLTVSMNQCHFKIKCSKCYEDAVKLCFFFWLNLVCHFSYRQIICYKNALFLTFCCYMLWCFQCFNNDCMGCRGMFICGKYQFFCASSSLGIRFVF